MQGENKGDGPGWQAGVPNEAKPHTDPVNVPEKVIVFWAAAGRTSQVDNKARNANFLMLISLVVNFESDTFRVSGH